jgi:hypothetical protein
MPELRPQGRCVSATVRGKLAKLADHPICMRMFVAGCEEPSGPAEPVDASGIGVAAYSTAYGDDTETVARPRERPNTFAIIETEFAGFRSRKPPNGDEDMVCPPQGAYPTIKLNACSMRLDVGAPMLVRVSSPLGRRGGLAKAGLRHASMAGSARRSSCPFQTSQMAPFVPPCRAPALSSHRLPVRELGGSGSSARALPQRVLHGQQNAHRCLPSGRDPGGGAAR